MGGDRKRKGVTRRTVLAGLVGASAAAAVGSAGAEGQESAPASRGTLVTRPFGTTGFRATIIGFGAFEIGRVDQELAGRITRALIEGGVNYIDTASSYGNSEEHLGQALSGGWREKVFLATKILERSREAAEKELARSFRRLRTDRLDLVQLHALNTAADLDAVFRKGGAFEALEAAVKRGDVRFAGITGHRRGDVLIEAMARQSFASVLFPVGPADAQNHDFLPAVAAEAGRRGMARIAMKVFAAGRNKDIEGCIRYALSRDVDTAILGMETLEQASRNLALARAWAPPKAEEEKEILARAEGIARDLWWKK